MNEAHEISGENVAALAAAFERMGASAEQAKVMAKQLAKRAVQLAAERGVAVELALQELLEKAAAGRRGDYVAPPARAPAAEVKRPKSN